MLEDNSKKNIMKEETTKKKSANTLKSRPTSGTNNLCLIHAIFGDEIDGNNEIISSIADNRLKECHDFAIQQINTQINGLAPPYDEFTEFVKNQHWSDILTYLQEKNSQIEGITDDQYNCLLQHPNIMGFINDIIKDKHTEYIGTTDSDFKNLTLEEQSKRIEFINKQISRYLTYNPKDIVKKVLEQAVRDLQFEGVGKMQSYIPLGNFIAEQFKMNLKFLRPPAVNQINNVEYIYSKGNSNDLTEIYYDGKVHFSKMMNDDDYNKLIPNKQSTVPKNELTTNKKGSNKKSETTAQKSPDDQERILAYLIREEVLDLQKNISSSNPKKNEALREDLAKIVAYGNQPIKDLVSNKTGQQDVPEFLDPLIDALFYENHTTLVNETIITENPELYEKRKGDITPTPIVNFPLTNTNQETNFSDLILEFQKHETIDDDNKLKVNKIGSEIEDQVRIIKQLQINVPENRIELVFSLKRFQFDVETDITSKITSNVIFNNLHFNQKQYEITAFIWHKGILRGGHYKAYIKENINGWHCYNDEKVSKVDDVNLLIAMQEAYVVKYTLLNEKLPAPQTGTLNLHGAFGNRCWMNASFAFVKSFTSISKTNNINSNLNIDKIIERNKVLNSFTYTNQQEEEEEEEVEVEEEEEEEEEQSFYQNINTVKYLGDITDKTDELSKLRLNPNHFLFKDQFLEEHELEVFFKQNDDIQKIYYELKKDKPNISEANISKITNLTKTVFKSFENHDGYKNIKICDIQLKDILSKSGITYLIFPLDLYINYLATCSKIQQDIITEKNKNTLSKDLERNFRTVFNVDLDVCHGGIGSAFMAAMCGGVTTRIIDDFSRKYSSYIRDDYQIHLRPFLHNMFIKKNEDPFQNPIQSYLTREELLGLVKKIASSNFTDIVINEVLEMVFPILDRLSAGKNDAKKAASFIESLQKISKDYYLFITGTLDLLQFVNYNEHMFITSIKNKQEITQEIIHQLSSSKDSSPPLLIHKTDIDEGKIAELITLSYLDKPLYSFNKSLEFGILDTSNQITETTLEKLIDKNCSSKRFKEFALEKLKSAIEKYKAPTNVNNINSLTSLINNGIPLENLKKIIPNLNDTNLKGYRFSISSLAKHPESDKIIKYFVQNKIDPDEAEVPNFKQLVDTRNVRFIDCLYKNYPAYFSNKSLFKFLNLRQASTSVLLARIEFIESMCDKIDTLNDQSVIKKMTDIIIDSELIHIILQKKAVNQSHIRSFSKVLKFLKNEDLIAFLSKDSIKSFTTSENRDVKKAFHILANTHPEELVNIIEKLVEMEIEKEKLQKVLQKVLQMTDKNKESPLSILANKSSEEYLKIIRLVDLVENTKPYLSLLLYSVEKAPNQFLDTIKWLMNDDKSFDKKKIKEILHMTSRNSSLTAIETLQIFYAKNINPFYKIIDFLKKNELVEFSTSMEDVSHLAAANPTVFLRNLKDDNKYIWLCRLDIKNTERTTPLHIISEGKNPQIFNEAIQVLVKKALSAKDDFLLEKIQVLLTKTNIDDLTALHLLAKKYPKGFLDTITFMANHGAFDRSSKGWIKFEKSNSKDRLTVEDGSPLMIKWLKDAMPYPMLGEDNPHGFTPLHYLAEFGSNLFNSTLEILITNGKEGLIHLLEKKSKNQLYLYPKGSTALHILAKKNPTEFLNTIRSLEKGGLFLNSQQYDDLLYSSRAEREHDEFFKKSYPILQVLDIDAKTPLHYLAKYPDQFSLTIEILKKIPRTGVSLKELLQIKSTPKEETCIDLYNANLKKTQENQKKINK
jgi:hypothetical protein